MKNNERYDNKTLRKNHRYFNYVIIAHKDGVLKYISKDYGRKNKFFYTVLLEKAKKFRTYQDAQNFVTNYEISSVSRIAEVSVSMDIR